MSSVLLEGGDNWISGVAKRQAARCTNFKLGFRSCWAWFNGLQSHSSSLFQLCLILGAVQLLVTISMGRIVFSRIFLGMIFTYLYKDPCFKGPGTSKRKVQPRWPFSSGTSRPPASALWAWAIVQTWLNTEAGNRQDGKTLWRNCAVWGLNHGMVATGALQR